MAPEPYPSTQNWSTKYILLRAAGCIAGHFVHLLVGALYSWGIVNIYITSYYKTLDPSVTLQSNAVAFPLMMFCIGITMCFGIYFAEATHPLIALSISGTLLSASIFISSYMSHIWGFFFFYGIFFGLILGSMFMIPIVQCNKYFPGKKMYVNGVIMAGAGFGSMVFGMFAFEYLNPQKLHPQQGYYIGTQELQDIAHKVPTLLRLLSLLYLITVALAVGLLAPVAIQNRKLENEQKEKDRIKEEENKKNGIVEQNNDETVEVPVPGEASTLKEAFAARITYIQAIFVMLIGCGLYLLNGNYKTYAKHTINDDEFLTLVGVAGAIANGCFRFFWNLLFFKTGYKFVMLCILTLEITVLTVIRYTLYTPGAYLVMIFLSNACLGGLLVTTTTVLQIIFGQKTGSNIVGIFWCVIATTNFIQYFYVSNLSKTIGFDNIINIVLGMACAAVPIVIFNTFQGPWKNDISAVQYCISCQANNVKPESLPQDNFETTGDFKLQKQESCIKADLTLSNPITEKVNVIEDQKKEKPVSTDKMDKKRRLDPIKAPVKQIQNVHQGKENKENNESMGTSIMQNSGVNFNTSSLLSKKEPITEVLSRRLRP